MKAVTGKQIKNLIFLSVFMLCCVSSYAQFSSGKKFVCLNSTEAYTYNGGQAGCVVTWNVVGGIFPDYSNSTSQQLTTGSDGKSIMNVKWTDPSFPNISVTTTCLYGNDSEDIVVDEIPLTVTANPATLSLGGSTTLTASSSYTNTYTWTSTTGGGLNSTSGNPVTAEPENYQITYTATATHVFLHNIPPNQVQVTCTQKATAAVSVAIPPITGNSVCCSQCISSGTAPYFLLQTSGVTLSGGNGSAFTYQWQKSTDGTSFSNITSAGTNYSYTSGPLTQKTWFRRLVIGGGVQTSISAPVIVDVVNAPISPTITTFTYIIDSNVKAFGTMTIQGTQATAMNAEVNFIADTKIVVSPSAVLMPGVKLWTVASLCDLNSGARMSSETLNPTLLDIEENLTLSEDVKTISNENVSFSIFPNPAKDEIEIVFQKNGTARVTLDIIDSMGNIVGEVSDSSLKETNKLYFNCSNLAAGIYFCKLTTGNSTAIKKLIVKH